MKKFFLIFILIITSKAFCCTTILVTKKATKDGSLIVSHSDDDELGDQRIVSVPAKKNKKGDRRAIYPDLTTNYPRYVGKSSSKAYDIKGYKPTEPLGYIDEVASTYSYFDGNYGIINEKQLSLGECTNSTYFYYDQEIGKRIMGIGQLSKIALERCDKAKDAIHLMGALAEKYGYYGYGETLLVADKEEGWVFEISCDPEGESAIWVAKKVPDGEVFVAANQFRIQEINPDDPDILYSSNLFDLSKKYNWNKNKTLNWLQAVCPGEFDHPYYSLRRVWRAFDLINPSLKLSPYVENAFTKYYPFSIKPQNPLTIEDIMKIHRDHYEGTEFDLTKGTAAGPYGCPNRYVGKYDRVDFPNKMKTKLKGAWERSISIYYTGYTYVTQIRDYLPDAIGGITWIGFDDASLSCFVPFYAGINDLPKNIQYGSPQTFDKSNAWWPFNTCANWISYFYYASKDIIKKQNELEKLEFDNQLELEKKALEMFDKSPKKAKKFLTKYCIKNSDFIVNEWWSLLNLLLAKYRDGFINIPEMAQLVGYPNWWLENAGYENGPINYMKKYTQQTNYSEK
ncbi:MAG: C69 family dipeptidase [Parachlamydiales bacterium]|jgi:dipeptidase